VNLRTGPGTSYAVRTVLPSGAKVTTINVAAPSNGFFNVQYNGLTGWTSGTYLTLVSTPGPSAARQAAVARAASGVGFSYWWGHGRFIPNGATSTSIGSCTGDCPSCTHAGSYGADCSGYLGKVWQVPSGNTDPKVDSHAYSTITFNAANSQWYTVDRGSVVLGDAMTYNTNGAGHIFLYESGDGWGSMWTYEARGCVYGIVHNLRTAGTEFKAIAHTGY
jgi:cell wall-associated NlpC family hydrolase